MNVEKEKQKADERSRFVVGIDLGTTNSAAAFVDTRELGRGVRVFPVTQFVGAGEVEAREVLPSFHYAPAAGEFAGMRLPWETEGGRWVIGVLARDHGVNAPGRLVVSAKSWLSHPAVDRSANLLPWHGAADVEKLSPTEVSARYLGHIRAAWNHEHPDYPLEQQDVVVTIPASFDEVARELTVTAARKAGLRRIVLLEEPQAAFYAWIQGRGGEWDRRLTAGQTILVCDVGGGTTDLTLIQVKGGEGGAVRFHRFAVGEHLILGGDNLDLALAHFLEGRLAKGGKLDARQWSVLVRRCQQVKESLLGKAPPERATVVVGGGGSRLIGGGLSAEVTRGEAVELLVNGFLPRVTLDEKPARRGSGSGFKEFGLPYAPDAAITRYLAAFLKAHRDCAPGVGDGWEGKAVRPDIVLFNGGFFESEAMRERFLEVLTSWFGGGKEPGWAPVVLKNERLDLAVALGAAYYGLVRRGLGVRISGGLARSYYIGVRTEAGETMALCLAPAGLEEGAEVHIKNRGMELLIRQPVEFPLFVSSSRTTDAAGDLAAVDGSQLTALPPIRTVLQAGKKQEEAERVTVQLHARLTEIGTLEVWCGEVDGGRRWKLQFDVRAATQTDREGHGGAGEREGVVDETVAGECLTGIRNTFEGGKSAEPPERLVKGLEETSGMTRLEWPPSLLRTFWEGLMAVEAGRRQSIQHEARWLNLLGFSLRPGYGVAVDDWRVARTWSIFEKKVAHASNELCRAEWWVLWRRIAGGLVPGQQRILADPLVAALRARARAEKSGAGMGKARVMAQGDFKFGPHETQEAWRLLGSLELLTADMKVELGEMALAELGKRGAGSWGGAVLWALGRFGARTPMHGPGNTTAPVEAVEKWIEAILPMAGEAEGVWLALMQMSRLTEDRHVDVGEAARARVIERMTEGGAPAHYAELVRRGGDLRSEERDLVFGEQLPQGLRLK